MSDFVKIGLLDSGQETDLNDKDRFGRPAEADDEKLNFLKKIH
jgi:hypothetical protein